MPLYWGMGEHISVGQARRLTGLCSFVTNLIATLTSIQADLPTSPGLNDYFPPACGALVLWPSWWLELSLAGGRRPISSKLKTGFPLNATFYIPVLGVMCLWYCTSLVSQSMTLNMGNLCLEQQSCYIWTQRWAPVSISFSFFISVIPTITSFSLFPISPCLAGRRRS